MRNRYLFLLDLCSAVVACLGAFALRFDTLNLNSYLALWWAFIPICVLTRVTCLYELGLYRRLWRYASLKDLRDVAIAVAVGSVMMGVLIFGVAKPVGILRGFPRSVLLIEGLLSLFFAGGIRLLARVLPEPSFSRARLNLKRRISQTKRVLVAGAGDAGIMVVKEMQSNPGLGLEPVAFVDDDPQKHGFYLHGVPVLGDLKAIPALVREVRVDEVAIAMPTAPGHVIRKTIELCRQCGVPFKTVPGLYEILNGSVHINRLREVRLEDLLRREPIELDSQAIAGYIKGATVLVTGAGGSIGSELCRQVMRFGAARLILLDHSENNLFHICHELSAHCPPDALRPVVGDIRDKRKVETILAKEKPHLVFHAAAYKHVPLMEHDANVCEAVDNNVLGTRTLLEASVACGVPRFVFISTDKAVNPRSVMGATKLVAERMVQDVAKRYGRAYVVVRFGNVLGSSGSVVPIFQQQIASGGPVTVTHPQATRYFMTLPEAVSLVIQAAAMGKGGEVFVLDMGKPVRILDLAKDMIRLSGLEPDQDIQIVFTGLRAGEKLHEELFYPHEKQGTTRHRHIFIAEANVQDGAHLHQNLQVLERLVAAGDATQMKRKLKEIIPQYENESMSQ